MRYLRSVTFLVSAVLIWTSWGMAATPPPYAAKLVSSGELTIATTGNAAPWTQTTATGGLQGYSVELCEATAKGLNLNVKWVVVDFAATLAGVTTGRFDMVCSSISQTPARKSSTDFFLTVPTVENGTTVIVRSDDSSIKTVDDVKGKTIGAIANTISLDNIKKALNDNVAVRIYPGYTEAILDLKNRRVDAVPSDTIIASYYAKNDPALKAVPAKLFPYLIGEVVRREEPELLNAVNSQFKAFLSDGTAANLQRKWFGTVSLPPQ